MSWQDLRAGKEIHAVRDWRDFSVLNVDVLLTTHLLLDTRRFVYPGQQRKETPECRSVGGVHLWGSPDSADVANTLEI